MQVAKHRGLLYTLISVAIMAVGTIVAINYAKGGYRITNEGFRQNTGLLSANSLPTGAQVFINDKLVTATDDTLYLEPGNYSVKIVKDGYSTWQKNLDLEAELVTQTNARLFPSAPSITPLTFTGAENLLPSPDGQKIIYFTASNSASKKNGLYVLDLAENTLSLQKGPRQIAENTSRIDLSQSQYIWSPDSSQLILVDENHQLLLDINKLNDLDATPDISFRSKQILDEWEEEMLLREIQFLSKFPEEIVAIATQSAQNVYFSPDKKRLLYTATASAEIAEGLIPPLPATSTQPQERSIQAGGIYVYDREEDKNFRIGTTIDQENKLIKNLLSLEPLSEVMSATAGAATSGALRSLQSDTLPQTVSNFMAYHSAIYADTYQWHPDSKHIIFTSENQIKVIEYDGSNTNTIYSGPFFEQFVYPWPTGSRLLVLTGFSPDVPLNLYAIELE